MPRNRTQQYNDSSISTAKLQDGAVTTAKLGTISKTNLPAGLIIAVLVDGVDETATPAYTVSGMVATSKIQWVETQVTKAAIATQTVRVVANFTPVAGGCTVVGGAVNNTNNQMKFVFSP